MSNQLWETEEFEDYITKGIIGLYESRPKQNQLRNKLFHVSDAEIAHVKSHGLYFAPGDRIALPFEVDCEQPGFAFMTDCGADEIPGFKSIDEYRSHKHDPDGVGIRGYMHHFYCQRIGRRIPAELKPCFGIGHAYEIIQLLFFSEGGIFADKTYAFLRKNGKTDVLLHRHPEYFPYPDQMIEDAVHSSVKLALSINFHNDRKYLWNVQAKEKEARVLFGVYPEQIKSLFYARDSPVKGLGRKRPILHWVSEHRRRIKSGIDVNIDKYLRGTTKFEMNGTEFEIITPRKAEISK